METIIPLITIYITNHNYGKYIKNAIESVLNQTFQNFELIIIDDGSTDDSKNIIEEYRGHEKIQIIYQQNKGLNITNNIAMRAANSKYLMRLDADDFLEKEALEVMSDILEMNPEIGLVFPDYYYVDEHGNRIGEERRHNFETEVSLYDQPAHGACTMIRLDFLKKVGGYNESFSCQDGYELWIKFIMHYKIRNVNKPLFSYRQHGNNLTSKETKILDTRIKIKENFIDESFKRMPIMAIIPIRNVLIDGNSWPLMEVDNETILEKKVKICHQSNNIKKIVITSDDHDIIEFSREKFKNINDIYVLKRPSEYAVPGQDLSNTAIHALENIDNSDEIEGIISLSLEYPFITAEYIDDAINTLLIFEADTVLSVRVDNRMYYQHKGHGLVPILEQDKFTRLEREALFKSVGGIIATTKKSLLKRNKLISGKISHIIVDEKASFGVFSKFDLHLFNLISNK